MPKIGRPVLFPSKSRVSIQNESEGSVQLGRRYMERGREVLTWEFEVCDQASTVQGDENIVVAEAASIDEINNHTQLNGLKIQWTRTPIESLYKESRKIKHELQWNPLVPLSDAKAVCV
ncbi:unnamed protein product [Dovyalis caffra]|uniref:Uncharacterized protein n=1 Tax=Dovyalis caffra TaxID=77055 RepID=A0AAV1RHH2_9ROSI|nr:unnamed protein product [Dovyalis caffra]